MIDQDLRPDEPEPRPGPSWWKWMGLPLAVLLALLAYSAGYFGPYGSASGVATSLARQHQEAFDQEVRVNCPRFLLQRQGFVTSCAVRDRADDTRVGSYRVEYTDRAGYFLAEFVEDPGGAQQRPTPTPTVTRSSDLEDLLGTD